MSTTLIVLLALLLLIALLAAQTPVAFALGASGLVGTLLLQGSGLATTTLARLPFQATAKYSLIVVPMFIFMGLLAMHGGISDAVFRIGNRVLRRFPGGLGLATVAACAGFAAVSGSSVATAATVGRTAIHEMRRYGYSLSFAAGIVGASGTLGVLIPPSIVLVLYGVVSGESIGALLLAGIIPGLLSATLYGGAIVVRVRRNPSLVQAGSSVQEAIDANVGTANPATTAPRGTPLGSASSDDLPVHREHYYGAARLAVLFLIVVGGIYTGFFTATESAALGGFAALVLTAFYLGRRSRGAMFGKLAQAAQESASVSSMVFAILVGSTIFTAFLVQAQVPNTFAEWVLGIGLPGIVVVLILLVALIPLGMFLDPISILVITVPLAYPVVVTELGYDGVWFGILMVKLIELGLITPPVGLNAYVVAGASPDVDVETAFKGLAPFFLIDLLTVTVLVSVPWFVTVLPSMAGH